MRKTDFSPDASATLMAGMLRMEQPFTFVRYGDGAIECIFEKGRGRTCDGEVYSRDLGLALLESWRSLNAWPVHQVCVGDWMSAAFDGRLDTQYETEWSLLSNRIAPTSILVHFEALLLHRESAALLDFYQAAREDIRPKVYIGPYCGAAKLLGAAWINVPLDPPGGMLDHVEDVYARLHHFSQPVSVIYWSAGMAGSIIIAKDQALHPERTYINLGSALDPLFRGRSRSQQISPERARTFMREFLQP